MLVESSNYPIENFWQFVHCHPLYGAFILSGIFILLIILCRILRKFVNILKTICNRLNTFSIGGISFTVSDKALKSANLDSFIQEAILKRDEKKSTFEAEAWKLLESRYLKDPYEDWQYAAVAATIHSHALVVELKSAKGVNYDAEMSEEKGNYFFNLYSQNVGNILEESKKVSNHFTSAAEIDLFLSKH